MDIKPGGTAMSTDESDFEAERLGSEDPHATLDAEEALSAATVVITTN